MPNGSFEEYSECPTGNELNNGQFERAIGWFRPTNSTPDFYHQCNNNGSGTVGIPNNFWGYQEPLHGDGYAGFGAIEWSDEGQIYGVEYLRSKLKTPLKPFMKYHFSMYISLCDYSTYGVGEIGALFTVENVFTPTFFALDESPQIVYNGTPIIDTNNWTKIEGDFIADGLEEYLTIGYFRDTPYMDTIKLQEGFYLGAFYYVDSISLHEVGVVSGESCEAAEIAFPNIITPNSDNSNDFIDASKYFAITDEIVILNRWGNVIRILTEEQPIWDGTTRNGKDCTEGVYFYKFQYDWSDKIKEKSGFIHLVR
ncbi:MAG: gliding motility-associated C-terminal domain-containing protein [Brumimicrobium sp.]